MFAKHLEAPKWITLLLAYETYPPSTSKRTALGPILPNFSGPNYYPTRNYIAMGTLYRLKAIAAEY